MLFLLPKISWNLPNSNINTTNGLPYWCCKCHPTVVAVGDIDWRRSWRLRTSSGRRSRGTESGRNGMPWGTCRHTSSFLEECSGYNLPDWKVGGYSPVICFNPSCKSRCEAFGTSQYWLLNQKPPSLTIFVLSFILSTWCVPSLCWLKLGWWVSPFNLVFVRISISVKRLHDHNNS